MDLRPFPGVLEEPELSLVGETFTGRVKATIVDGRLVYDFDRGVLIR